MPGIDATQQCVYTSEAYYQHSQASFDLFSQSRHSLRHFSTTAEVSVDEVVKAIELAQNAPSSCNRQSSRVHVVAERPLIEAVLALQNGNRGFGHLVSKLLVLTVDLSCYNGINERNLCYIDSGIYAMNLLYALHHQQIGACTLNWCDSPEDDAKLRSLLDIPASETITLFIACGKAPEGTFKVASSPRVEAKNVITIHTKSLK
jgi:nitroreductase